MGKSDLEKLNLLKIGDDFFEGLFDTFVELFGVDLFVVALFRSELVLDEFCFEFS